MIRCPDELHRQKLRESLDDPHDQSLDDVSMSGPLTAVRPAVLPDEEGGEDEA